MRFFVFLNHLGDRKYMVQTRSSKSLSCSCPNSTATRFFTTHFTNLYLKLSKQSVLLFSKSMLVSIFLRFWLLCICVYKEVQRAYSLISLVHLLLVWLLYFYGQWFSNSSLFLLSFLLFQEWYKGHEVGEVIYLAFYFRWVLLITGRFPCWLVSNLKFLIN